MAQPVGRSRTRPDAAHEGSANLLKSALIGAGERGTEQGVVASLATALCVDPRGVSVQYRPGDAQKGEPSYSFQVEIDISSQQPNTVMNQRDAVRKQEAIEDLERQVFLIIDTVKPAQRCDQLKIPRTVKTFIYGVRAEPRQSPPRLIGM